MTLKSKSEGKEENLDPKQKKRRSLYEDGFAPIDYKNSSVQKLIILAMSPSVETHDNIEQILKLLNISLLEFAYSTDIKMILILVGKQGGSCTHSCPFCEGASPWLQEAPRTTIGSLWRNYEDFMRPANEGGGGGNDKVAKNFQNVTKKPLITGNDDQLILGQTFFWPELHVLIGLTGKLMKELERSSVFLSEKEGREFLCSWEKGHSIQRTAFHGTTSYTGTYIAQ